MGTAAGPRRQAIACVRLGANRSASLDSLVVRNSRGRLDRKE
jgi:hypothetical protein